MIMKPAKSSFVANIRKRQPSRMKVGLFFVGFITCAAASSLELLAIDAGTGVSFIDLWNLNGVSVGTDGSSDSVYRSGLIDNGFSFDCPSRLYFKLDSPGYTVQYRGTYTDTTLSSWIQTTPYSVQYSADINDAKIEVLPQSDVLIRISSYAAPSKLFLEVYHPSDAAPYPQYYDILDDNPLEGPVPANAANFNQPTRLTIKARYESGCDLTDYNTVSTLSDTLSQLQSAGQVQTTTTEATTTTTPEATTTTSTTTEATTTTTTEATTSATTITEATTTATTTTDATTTEATTPEATTTREATTEPAQTTETTPSDSLTTLPAAITSTSEQTPESTTSQDMCPCDCDFKNRLETISAKSDIPVEELKVILAPVIKEIKKNLTVDESKLSSSIRKKQSATDSRKSAEQVGVIGAVLLAFTFGLLLIIDITSLPRHLQLFKQNFWRSSSRNKY